MTQLRADAQRNLDRLLEAAGTCFAERGLDVSVDEIARAAGVGHGTVFRRFPTKEALVVAVLTSRLHTITKAAEAALEADPESAFGDFVRLAGKTYADNRALLQGLDRCVGTEEAAALRNAVGRLLARAQAARVVRTDVTADDVLELVPAAARFPEIVLDGLRPH